MVKSRNAAIVLEFIDLVFNRHEVTSGFSLHVGDRYIQHNPNVADGREAAIKGLSGFFQAVPGVRYDIKRVLADADLVAVHGHVTMHRDDPGQAVIDIFRLEGEKIVEHWDVTQPVPSNPANQNTMF